MATAIYIRVSTDMQEEKGVSLDAQREQLNAYCKFKGLKDVVEYLDVASARTTNRKNFKEMMTDAKSGRINNIIVLRLDRLTRSIVDLNKLITLLNDLDCGLHSAVENIDTKTATGRMIINLIGTFAQWESETISERVIFGMDFNASQGIWQGVAPFGYDIGKDKRLKINEKEKDILLEAFDMIENGYSIHYVENNLPKKYDLKWGESFLTRKIKSANIVGDIKRNDKIHKNTHEGIISRKRQNDFLKRMEDNASPRSPRNYKDIFRRKIKCYRCDKIMSLALTGSASNVTFGYRCKHCKKQDNVPVYASESKINDALSIYLKSISVDKVNVASDDKASVKLNEQLSDIDIKLDKIQRAWIDDMMSDSDLKMYQLELSNERDKIEGKLLSIDEPVIKKEFAESIVSLHDGFELMSRADKRTFFQKFVRYIEFERDLVEGTKQKYTYKIKSITFY